MKHIKIRFRLYIILMVSILATGGVAIFGIVNINRLSEHITVIDHSNVEPLNKLVRMTHYFDTLRSYLRDAVITFDPVVTDNHLDTVGRLYGQLSEIADAYLAHMVANGVTRGQEYDLISAFVRELPGAAAIVGRVAERASANDREGALRLIEDECVPYNTRMSNYLTDLAVYNQRQSSEMANAARLSATNALTATAITTVVSIVTLIILIGLITRSVIHPIHRLMDASKELEAGNLNIQLDTTSKDETGDLARTLNGVSSTLKDIVGSIKDMYHKHENEGSVYYTIDTSAFRGSYKEVADGVNQMVASYVKTCDDILETMENIANGDMKITLPAYKGNKGEVNKTVNKVTDTIKEIVRAIDALAKAGAEGNLDVTMDATRFGGEWAKIVKDMNVLMNAFGGAIGDTERALNELSLGNFAHRITTSYTGEYDKIKQAANHMGTSVDSYIKEVSDILGKIAKGDLTYQINRQYVGDFSAIKTSINLIVNNLNETIRNIASASEQVLTGSIQISESASLLAQGASQQAGSVEELNVSVGEINRQTQENAGNAQQASHLAKSSRHNAETGNTEMTALLEAMDGISKSSNEIGKIMKTIQDIAFQTNLLALNASVEAARAGEHGKGFTVVAEEVRALAGKSAEAVKNTGALIEDSINRVQEGTKRANDTATSLSHIVGNVAEVAEVIDRIYTASNQQAESIGGINSGIVEISQVVQRNTANSQESAASAQELNAQAQTLKEMVRFFKTH
jgi:methyl-accepting chemotaxis protein